MSYVLIGENQEDRELTKDEYEHLLDELVQYRLAKYLRELVR